MKDELSRYTLRVEQKLLDKLGYIAEYEGRTKNRELEPARRYSNPEDHRAAGLCRPQNCCIKQKSPGGCRGSLSLSCICWLL
jgi:hypothetical protein